VVQPNSSSNSKGTCSSAIYSAFGLTVKHRAA